AETNHHADLHEDYSLYLDLEHPDGSFTYGLVLPFRAAHDWQTLSGVIHPRLPVHVLHIYCLFRYRHGTAHFDDIHVRPLTAYDLCEAEAHAKDPTQSLASHNLKKNSANPPSYQYTTHTPLIMPKELSE
ncbi:hypothetical protein CYMTET_34217, partial [Cymbomonas tetramitiformis]